jgi:oxygen-independent coproporphyrinogen-3 oxidase
MRLFRRRGAPSSDGPVYCCQEDGMVGLGPGARSYTRALHYSDEWAVGAKGVREIVADWIGRSEDALRLARYGCELDAEEQRRRYVIKSVLRTEGLSHAAYRRRFGSDALGDLPELAELVAHGLATDDGACLRPTEAGLARSDTIGPWLYGERVRARSAGFEVR